MGKSESNGQRADLVIFDCDGVLVDSERLAVGVGTAIPTRTASRSLSTSTPSQSKMTRSHDGLDCVPPGEPMYGRAAAEDGTPPATSPTTSPGSTAIPALARSTMPAARSVATTGIPRPAASETSGSAASHHDGANTMSTPSRRANSAADPCRTTRVRSSVGRLESLPGAYNQ